MSDLRLKTQTSEKETVVGVTGPRGFVAAHLIHFLQQQPSVRVVPLSRDAWEDESALADFASECDAIIHLAGQNRGTDTEVYRTNVQLAEKLVAALKAAGTHPHIVFSSSTQRTFDNNYGKSKRATEEILSDWASASSTPFTVAVIPNVYGAGCRPHYNSVVATFCHELAKGNTPNIIEDREVDFIWINHLVEVIWQMLADTPSGVHLQTVAGSTRLKISELLALLTQFRDDYFGSGVVPDISSPVTASFYSTFLSHVELNDHRHTPEVHADNRGELYEVIKLANAGQVFFSTTKPGIIRGNHYHTRKVEWFCVLKGEATIRLRPIQGEQVTEFRVSGEKPEFISIPVLHTHHIENSGDTELLTMFWCNEIFDASDADTFYTDVLPSGTLQAAA